jgi:hypothetical protein
MPIIGNRIIAVDARDGDVMRKCNTLSGPYNVGLEQARAVI